MFNSINKLLCEVHARLGADIVQPLDTARRAGPNDPVGYL
jgi:hypothetical protein